MNLLIPLGLLGLLGIVALIIIYIIKPNYQQKYITSTYVWQLAKKYRKKKIPLNRLRDILLIVCQILIVTACALILSKPALITGQKPENAEIIVVIDSSASMLTKDNEGTTRFERAVKSARELVSDTLKANGTVSVILADDSPAFLLRDETSDMLFHADETLAALTVNDCGYGVADLDAAMKQCEGVIAENSETQVYLYTDNDYYTLPEGVILKRDEVLGEKEWNASILAAYVEKIDNYYNLTVEVACYSEQPRELNVKAVISGANVVLEDDVPREIILTDDISCKDSTVYKIKWQSVATDDAEDKETGGAVIRSFLLYNEAIDGDQGDKFFNFDKILITIDAGEKDSFTTDDSFEIYGGNRHEIKIQYYSKIGKEPYHNPYVRAIISSLQSKYADDWSISIDETKGDNPAIEGYDYYIFEHTMPASMPTDGFVFLIHPDKSPSGSGLTVAKSESTLPGGEDGAYLSYGEDGDGSFILENVYPSKIYVKSYVKVTGDSTYKTLMTTIDESPAVLFKDDSTAKVVVFTFSLHYSTLPMTSEFPLLMDNIFNYVFRKATDKSAYEVNDSVILDSMGESLTIKGSGEPIEFTSFKTSYKVTLPGAYTVTQTTVFGKTMTDTVFVSVNEKELNIFGVYDELYDPYGMREVVDYNKDLLLYFAIALVALLFIEWILKITDNT